MSQPKITAYMKPVCGWSNGVRAIFQKYGLEYDDRDIINNADNYREMVEKSGQPLQPTIEINGEIIADVSGDEVEAYLISKGYVQQSDAETGVATDAACDDHGEAVDVSAERDRFVEALEDDLGTPQALAAVFDLARAVNRGRDAGHDVRAAQATLAELTRDVLGLRLEEPDAVEVLDVVALSKLASKHGVSCGGSDAESTIEALLAARTEARADRNFARADAIRSDLADAGVELADTPEGPRWSAGR